MTDDSDIRPDSIPTGSIQWDSSWPEFSDHRERHHLFSYLEERFGISSHLFNDYLLLKKRKNWWLLKDSSNIASASHLKIWMSGLKAFQEVGRYIKPTTRMIQIFGGMATRAKVEIERDDLKRMISGDSIPTTFEMENGYIILCLNEIILGLGLLINNVIIPQIPKKDVRFLTF